MSYIAEIASPAQAAALRTGDVLYVARIGFTRMVTLEPLDGSDDTDLHHEVTYAGAVGWMAGKVRLLSEPGMDELGRLCVVVEPVADDAPAAFEECAQDNPMLDGYPLRRREVASAA